MKSSVIAMLFVVCLSAPVAAQDLPRFEIHGGATFLRDPDNSNRYGWLGSFATNVNQWFAVKAEIAGYYTSRDAGAHTFLMGPQFNLRRNGSKLQPYAQFLVGAQLDQEQRLYFNPVPPGTSFVRNEPTGLFAISPGGGVDVPVNSRISLRLGADYLRGFRQVVRDNTNYRAHMGVVFKLP